MPEGPALLDELPEARASGEIERIYAGIKRLSGAPMVALIYRHLATIPGALDWAWALLEPALRSGELQQRAWQLAWQAGIDRQPAIPPAALRAVGLGAAEQVAIATVLDAYNRANPVNIMAVRCLALRLAADGARAARGESPPWQPPALLPALPPMVDPRVMAPVVRELVLLLTDRGPTDSPSPLVPSLYRHLAHWPAFLGYAAVLVPPAFDAIDAAAERLRQQVDRHAATLAGRLADDPRWPAPTGEAARHLQSAIAQFSQRIPEMVVIGNLLRRALPPVAV